LFSEYDIHCTWATVGMLFNKDWEERKIKSFMKEEEKEKWE
jgi:hypothetical protein